MQGRDAISRRSFCGAAIAAFGIAAIGASCKQRVKVLKYPENAEEVADLFELFTDRDFSFEAAKAGLKITGEPRSFDSSENWRRNTFPKQNELIREIELGTSKGELSSMYIYYQDAIEVSLRRLESLLGTAKRYDNHMVGKADLVQSDSIAALTNRMPNSPPDNRPPTSSFGFYPAEPLTPNSLKGSLLIRSEHSDANLKRVNFLRYERRNSAEK